jgi:hypothetical protein
MISIFIIFISYILLKYAKNKSDLFRVIISLFVLFFLLNYGSFSRGGFSYEIIFVENYLYSNLIQDISLFMIVLLSTIFAFT